ncbi:uncharacterized protein N7515_005834 [Penicillium bovifimosum]|uniref:Uncharacterized protein n=1 Tax=Penicillium bovifimosum TaxID=126998 RepID=A0A9W9GTH2_9EURO|nr:uncharacterized protein N7515_005834 [Penicillium bovifimosum]KAJ5129795.1 hypothetical protein N7515_005834 [Penicillium bovifimosum]
MADAVFGAPGWEVYSAMLQDDRRVRVGATTPAHLTRTLYIPRHDGSGSHLSVHDISTLYQETVGDRNIGSASYLVSLGKMQKPQSELDDTTVYNVGFKDAVELHGQSISVTAASPGHSPLEANVAINADGNEAVITMKCEQENDVQTLEDTPMSISYPISPTKFDKRAFVHPYFTFRLPGVARMTLEWQVHPVEHGRLRYTLVRISEAPSSVYVAGSGVPLDEDVLAIYHHVGDGISLPLPYSEGVLLLSPDMEPATETIVVASVLGVLLQLRQLRKAGKGTKKGTLGFIKGLLKK